MKFQNQEYYALHCTVEIPKVDENVWRDEFSVWTQRRSYVIAEVEDEKTFRREKSDYYKN